MPIVTPKFASRKAELLIKYAPSIIYEIDFRGPKFVSVNDFMCKRLGYTRKELLAMNPSDLLTPESKKLFSERMSTFVSGNKIPKTIEYSSYCKNGEIMWGILNMEFTYENGQPKGAFAITQDITERKKIEEKIVTSESKFHTIFESAPIYIALLNTEGKFVSVNTAAYKLHGCNDKKELLRKNFFSVIDETSLAKAKSAWKEIISKGQAENAELFMKKCGGQKADVLLSGVLIHEGSKKEDKVLLMIRDISNLVSTTQRYTAMFQLSQDGVWMIDKKGHLMEVNETYCKMSGYTRTELLGMSVKHLEANESPTEVSRHIQQIIRGKQNRFESRHRRKNGSLFDVDVTATFMDVEGGRFVVFIRDITPRKKMEEELREGQKKFQALIETTGDFIWELDSRGRFTYCSPQMKQLWGYKPESMIGKTPVSLMPISEKKKARDYAMKLASTGKSVRELQTYIYDSNNKLTFVETRSAPFFDSAGKLLGFRGISRDITDHKKSQEMLLKSEIKYQETSEYLQNLLNYASAPIICWDTNYKITLFNHAFEYLTGYDDKEVLGKKLTMLFPGNAIKEIVQKIQLTMKGQHWLDVEIPVRKKDGKIRTVLWNSANIYTKKGKTPSSTIAQGIDITDRIHLEQQKDEFFSVASHELKTPLTSIKAFTEILGQRMEKAGDRETGHILKHMDSQIDRLTKLIITMLDVTKIESGRMVYEKSPFKIDELVREIFADMKLTIARNREIRIICRAKKIVYADRFRIGQVVSNLLQNAIKYSPASKPIIIRSNANSHDVTISVQDFGIGIPESKLSHLFEKFYQINLKKSNAESFSNLGLGLYISSDIVKRHGGKIWVKSKFKEGSTFYFSIPINNR